MSTKRNDFASGLVYFGYRFYMPNLGRWLNRDPLQEAGGINLYAYVMGDPMGYVDPDGRYPDIPQIPGGIPAEAIIPPHIKNFIDDNVAKTECSSVEFIGNVYGALGLLTKEPILKSIFSVVNTS